MKQTIRFNTFETNSSSTHNCVICTEDEYKKWQAGEIYVDYNGNMYTKEQVIKEFEKEDGMVYVDDDELFDAFLRNEEYDSYDRWFEEDYLESDITVREINGTKIYVCCKFGYDG